MSLADIIQIIIGVLSLVATIAVSFLIYWLQSRHEKEIQKLQCEKERIALQEKARLFLIDNQEERDYLPWCIIAANLYPLEKHTRKIYVHRAQRAPVLQKSPSAPYALTYCNVGADAHIGPLGSYEFAADFRRNSAFCRADVGIGPYGEWRNNIWRAYETGSFKRRRRDQRVLCSGCSGG